MNDSNGFGRENIQQLVELYAIGALTAPERIAFERAIDRGDVDLDALNEYLTVVTRVFEEVAAALPTPRRALKDSIMSAAIGGDPEGHTEETRQVIVRADQGEWVETGIPGITMKILYQDEVTSRVTCLVRLAPGAEYPQHRHMGVEECLVLEGDLHVNDRVLRAGDYTVTHSGKIHNDTHSEEGCLLMLVSPMDDEFI